MKTVLSGVLMVLTSIGVAISGVWAIVEFILHLAKDKPFDWMSVWFIIGGIVLTVAFWGAAVLFAVLADPRVDGIMRHSMKRSKWQERMEKMQKKRNIN